MKTITTTQLANLLGKVTHATPVAFCAVTDARARKGSGDQRNPFSSIQKWTKVSAFVGTIYENAVNRQLVREGHGDAPAFEAKERSWGNRISPALVSKLDAKTGEVRFYLPAQVQRTSKPLYLVPTGAAQRLTVVPKEKVAPWLPASRAEETAVAQGVEKPVIYRDYLLSSIRSISIDGERYRVRS